MDSQIPGPTDMSDGVMTPEETMFTFMRSCSFGKDRTVGDSGLDTNSQFSRSLIQSRKTVIIHTTVERVN